MAAQMKEVRAFIALEMPPAIEQDLREIDEGLRKRLQGLPLRWSAVENIHLTLKFLGEVPEKGIQQISKVIDQQARKIPPFEIKLNGLGAFPDLRRPRVLWVGVNAPENLARLQKHIEIELSKLGYAAEERKFNPHLTVARVAREAEPLELKRIGEIVGSQKPPTSDEVLIDTVTLFRSDLKASGSVYNRLFHAPLVGVA